MKKTTAILAALLLAACTPKGETFTVDGRIDGLTGDTTLVFEAVELTGDRLIDSIRLTPARNEFAFEAARPACPEFYRLRVGDQLLNLCIDSTEHVTVNATIGQLATGYTVEGSEKCEQLRQMGVLQQELRRDINAIASRDGMSPAQRMAAVNARIDEYKRVLVERFIAPDPASAVAYSALFQTFGGRMVFDPIGNRTDVRWMAAAATSWDLLYPGAARTENLHNVALQGLAATSKRMQDGIEISSDKVRESGIIDISLPDVNGEECRLSDLEDKVVILDFTAYGLKENGARQLLLRDLYSKYADRGLEIYQVGLDPDRHFWATRVEQLPWVCVYLDEGLDADLLKIYNVQSLPSFFLIGRGSNLHARGDMVGDVEAELKKLL